MFNNLTNHRCFNNLTMYLLEFQLLKCQIVLNIDIMDSIVNSEPLPSLRVQGGKSVPIYRYRLFSTQFRIQTRFWSERRSSFVPPRIRGLRYGWLMNAEIGTGSIWSKSLSTSEAGGVGQIEWAGWINSVNEELGVQCGCTRAVIVYSLITPSASCLRTQLSLHYKFVL